MPDDINNDPDFNDARPKPSPRRGNRFIELLVAVAIIMVLIALLIPARRSSRGAFRRSQCVYNLKQIGLALRNYELDFKALPPAYTVDANGRPLHSWRTLILPYLDQAALYQSIDLSKPWDDPANREVRETPLGVFHCPSSDAPRTTTTYRAIVAPDGCLSPDGPRPLAEITDPHDATLMVIEVGDVDAVSWMVPVDADEPFLMRIGQTSRPQHPGGMNALFVDGTVRFLKASVPAKVRRSLLTISGDDPVSNDEF